MGRRRPARRAIGSRVMEDAVAQVVQRFADLLESFGDPVDRTLQQGSEQIGGPVQVGFVRAHSDR